MVQGLVIPYRGLEMRMNVNLPYLIERHPLRKSVHQGTKGRESRKLGIEMLMTAGGRDHGILRVSRPELRTN